MSDVVLFEKRNKIAYVTINRPERRNSLNAEVRRMLAQAWREIRDDPDIWLGIVTGTGQESFCAGGDLAENLAKSKGDVHPPEYDTAQGRAEQSYTKYLREVGLNKPLIAAVNGYAAGGGFGLALNCDIRLCSENAKFGASEVRWSHMAGGQAYILPRTVPLGWAFWLCLTGQFIDAQTASNIGIVQGVYAPDQLMEEATKLADIINANGKVVVQQTKEYIYNSLDMPLTAARLMEGVYYQRIRQSPDYDEGSAAFTQKRKPRFAGEGTGAKPKL
ncbi:MAG TPA: enoyl-CoA hydratase/isomerase family protein [Chloroflexota bacterium]|nr:enoyl-CoA hydratase/isomerase family protein [Chloroflexota bacterium]